jgi:hypothetical protein
MAEQSNISAAARRRAERIRENERLVSAQQEIIRHLQLELTRERTRALDLEQLRADVQDIRARIGRPPPRVTFAEDTSRADPPLQRSKSAKGFYI